ncbi:MAG: UbiA family prenyltransferase [Anaerolineae bacterium]|nr:UbiA family prenyltransferase [Anaerolineae bacterium]
MKLLRDLLAMSHIFNGIGSAVGVAVGYLITCWYQGYAVDPLRLLMASVGTLLISNGGFIVNDIFDLPIDRINRPDRPLAAGRISVRQAWIVYLFSTVIGLLLGFAVNASAGVVGLAIAALLYLYSALLKKRFVLGHLSIALMGGLLLPFGGLAAGNLIPTIYAYPVTFLAFFCREVLKTVPDVDGDRTHGVDNLATRYGADTAFRFGQIGLTICLVLLPLMQTVWTLKPAFNLMVFVVIVPLFLLVTWVIARQDRARHVHNLLRLSKMFFLLVAVALLLGSLP